MKTYPHLPRLDDAPDDLLTGGHLWLQELVAGRHVRFRMAPSGLIEFGDRGTTFDPGDAPVPFGDAVRHVRERFDRDALRAAADPDPERFVFFAQATVAVGIDYDWARTPSALGFDVWDRDREAFLPPDATERAFERLGLHAVNAFRKELPVRDFQPSRYAIPDSAWYDGPAAGVVVRNTGGGTAIHENPAVEPSGPATSVDASAESAATLADRYVTADRVERATDSSENPDSDEVRDRVFELLVREEYAGLGGERRENWGEFRSAVGESVRRWLRDPGR